MEYKCKECDYTSKQEWRTEVGKHKCLSVENNILITPEQATERLEELSQGINIVNTPEEDTEYAPTVEKLNIVQTIPNKATPKQVEEQNKEYLWLERFERGFKMNGKISPKDIDMLFDMYDKFTTKKAERNTTCRNKIISYAVSVCSFFNQNIKIK